MKGTNTLTLNGATLIEALQEYFDKRITPNIKVVSVSADQSNNTFRVPIEERPAEKAVA